MLASPEAPSPWLVDGHPTLTGPFLCVRLGPALLPL